MTGNSFGKVFNVATFGESHGEAVGVVVDGVPAGLPLSVEDVQRDLNRRRPGKSEVETSREEADEVRILSGVFEGKTLGTPIAMKVENKDVDSEPYRKRRYTPRPGHADLTYRQKYTHVDYRGGGRSSGRETVGRVAAGAIAKKLLSYKGVEVVGHVTEIMDLKLNERPDIETIKERRNMNEIRCADPDLAERMKQKILEAKQDGDSTGGIVEVLTNELPAGLGEPVFDKLDAEIAKSLMSIGAVKGVEIGKGFQASEMRGSEMNDYLGVEEGKIKSRSNNAGGVLGGLSTGEALIARVAVKPTPSIEKSQGTVDLREGKETEISLDGRFDPNICPRIVPVAESMVAIVLVDMMLRAGELDPDKFEGYNEG
ncbi:MAG: chorismate synthase [Candidatus Hadarchaeota archaeon]